MGKVRTIKSMILCMFIMSIIIESVFMNQCVEVRADTHLIKGYVFEEPNNPSEGARVEFLRDGNVVKVRYTDEEGQYNFTYNIERFYIYTFQVSKYGFEPTGGVGPVPRRVAEFYNFTLSSPGENQYYIYGTVTDENSNHLLNARVEFLRDGNMVTYRNTNVTGQYAFNYGDDAGPHTYNLSVSKQDYQTKTADGPTSPGYFNCDFDLEYEYFLLRIEGFVKYNSNALGNATVECWENTDKLKDSRRTNEDGYYLGWNFHYYPIHNYELRAFHPNFTIEVQPVEVETGGILCMNFTMQDTMDRYVILLGINDFDSDGEKDEGIDFSDKHLRILEWYGCFREAFGIPDENFKILTDESPDDSIFNDTNKIEYLPYFSETDESTTYINNLSCSAATYVNTVNTLEDVLWNKADANDEVFICLISHGSNKSNNFELSLLNSYHPSEPDIINGTEISYIIENSQCNKIFVYTHACHGGKLGEILMDNPRKSSIYVATGCGAEGVVIYPFQKTLVTEIWKDKLFLTHTTHASPTIAMETLFKEAIQYMYNNQDSFLIDYSYFYNTNPPYERIYTYTINGTSYYGWKQSDFYLNRPEEYSLENGYRYNGSTSALNNTSGIYYYRLLDVNQSKYIWFFENITRFEELAEVYGYLIVKSPGISITYINIHGWEHLMPCEYDGDNQNYFING